LADPDKKNKQQAIGREAGGTLSRRDFLQRTGVAVIGATVCLGGCEGSEQSDDGDVDSGPVPAARGYLLVDTKKCQGCVSCMLMCSLVHEGVASLSLSRIQVLQEPFLGWPNDLTIEQCRQCVDPPCVAICPADALNADPDQGNIRVVDRDKCIGCGACVEGCPYAPSRPLLEPDEAHNGALKSRKCDLCANAPYHFSEDGGGPDGTQACIAVCPVAAIKFTDEIPEQKGDGGYKVNLRNNAWSKMGYPTAD
jgi:protein NrfC